MAVNQNSYTEGHVRCQRAIFVKFRNISEVSNNRISFSQKSIIGPQYIIVPYIIICSLIPPDFFIEIVASKMIENTLLVQHGIPNIDAFFWIHHLVQAIVD